LAALSGGKKPELRKYTEVKKKEPKPDPIEAPLPAFGSQREPMSMFDQMESLNKEPKGSLYGRAVPMQSVPLSFSSKSEAPAAKNPTSLRVYTVTYNLGRDALDLKPEEILGTPGDYDLIAIGF